MLNTDYGKEIKVNKCIVCNLFQTNTKYAEVFILNPTKHSNLNQN